MCTNVYRYLKNTTQVKYQSICTSFLSTSTSQIESLFLFVLLFFHSVCFSQADVLKADLDKAINTGVAHLEPRKSIRTQTVDMKYGDKLVRAEAGGAIQLLTLFPPLLSAESARGSWSRSGSRSLLRRFTASRTSATTPRPPRTSCPPPSGGSHEWSNRITVRWRL